MHQAQWSPERPLPPPVSLASQSHHEKPPEVTCTSRGNPGFPASTRESPRETFFNTAEKLPLRVDCIHRLEFGEVSGHRVLIKRGPGNRGPTECGTTHGATSG